MNSSPLFGQATWIASNLVGGKRTAAPVPYLRKTFQIYQPLKSAKLAITALGLYECEINGQRIGDEIFTPGWTDYHKRVQYQTYDVTAQLQQGENVIGAMLGDGWYCGIVGWLGRQIYGDRPRLMARLEVVLQDGSSFDIVTDGSWKLSTGPILESDIMMGEYYDSRRELGAWSQPGYDDGKWQPVTIAPPEHPVEIVPRVGPPVRALGEIKPISERRTWGDRTRIFDLGQNFTGRVRLRVKTSPGALVQIRYAEILNPDKSMYTENLRNARCTDTYTTKSDGIEIWEPRFTFHGFRYVEVCADALKPEELVEVTGIVLHSDTTPTGTFRCSHEGLNQLQHNIVWGQKSNFLEVPTDCPQRDERLGWTGDAQVFIRTASFNMNVREFFHKWMQDMRDSQTTDGGIPCVVPAPWHNDPASQDGGPAWADAEVICPWTIYLCYGDKKILEDHYESMQRYMVFMAKHRSRGHIRNHPDGEWHAFGDWLALDGGGKTEGITPYDLIGTAFYAYDAELMAKVADVLGRHDDAKQYRALHGEIVEAFRNRFVTPEGLIASGTQTSYVLALGFNLVPESVRAITAAELVRDVQKRNYHLATGFVGTPYILDVLEKTGHIDVAYKLLEQETFPSWLFPVRNGATTIWERWDGWTPDKGFQDKGMNSFNHYAYGAVGDWMYHTVAGLELDPNQPGYAHIIFRPRPGGSITWAEAKLQTVHGEAGIHWSLSGDELNVNFTVPANSTATFLPPPGYNAGEAKYGEGTHQVVLKKS